MTPAEKMDEMWVCIPDWPYAVSNIGRVKRTSAPNGRVAPDKVLSVPLSGRYARITLRDAPRRKTALVHRLVAEAFVPNPLGLPEVNHKNGDKYDNRAVKP